MADKQPWYRIGAMWEKQTKDGKPFFTGKLGDASIMVWPNEKTKDTQPDFIINVVAPKPKPTRDTGLPAREPTQGDIWAE